MMNVKPAIWTTYYDDLSAEDAIRALIKGGFRYGDFDSNQVIPWKNPDSIDMKKRAKEFKAFLDDVGFSVPQGHLDMFTDVTLREKLDFRKKELDFFLTLGVKNAVIHLSGASKDPMDVRREKNVEGLSWLQDYVRGTDMNICVENMNSPHYIRDGKRIMSILDDLGYTNLSVCLDTGHFNSAMVKEYTTETQRDFILQAGPYLKALHLNGNTGRYDMHVAPFCIHDAPDFMEIIKTLHEINYTGLFSLENGADGAREIPRAVKDRRLLYLRDLLDMMIDPDFVNQ